MNRITVSSWLRWALAADAVVSASAGLVLVVFSSPLSQLFNLPAAWPLGVGLFCLAYAALVGSAARRSSLPAWVAWTIAVGNALWALDSVLLIALDWLQPSQIGSAFVLTQAAIVFALAEWQYLGLRRSRPLDQPGLARA